MLNRELYQLQDYITNVINPHMTEGMRVTSLSASPNIRQVPPEIV